jgi:hypothetical protein
MSDNLFLAELPAPETASLEAALGAAFPWYEGLLAAAEGFQQEWRHYGKKYGWKMKIHDGSKALLELTIGERGLRVGLAVRERELEALREDPSASPVIGAFLDGEAASEGWGIRIDVRDELRYGQALILVKALAALRRSS